MEWLRFAAAFDAVYLFPLIVHHDRQITKTAKTRGNTVVNDPVKELSVRDMDEAMKAVGGNADLAQDLFIAFLDDLERQMQEIHRLHQSAAWAELEESSHLLHGGAAYCGVPALKAALKALEQSAATGDPEEIGHRMETLEREIERLFAVA